MLSLFHNLCESGSTLNGVQELAEWNKLYEAKFGFIFLICATGKPSHEILAALKVGYKLKARL